MKRKEIASGLRFTVVFLILFASAFVVLHYTPLKPLFGSVAATSSQALLNVAGIPTEIVILQNGNYSLESEEFIAELNEACSALVEIAVLLGIVFASFEKTLVYRFKGFAAGLLLLLILNPVRIALSIIFLDPLVHDVLFRVTLVIVIVGFYAVWHYWAELAKWLKGSGKKGGKRNRLR